MEPSDTFLRRHPPFDSLGLEQLRELAAHARPESYQPGHRVLIEDGPPARALGIVVDGSMELVHEGEVIQVLEPGECFGHPSLLTGLPPAFTVRAREPSRCLVVEAPAARRVLGTPAGAAYVAATMRKRMVGTGHTVHGLHDVGTTPVSAIMRPPAYCEADQSLRSAARMLGGERVSALLVVLGRERLGIVTDADVRAAAAVENVDLDAPVTAIARAPAATVPPAQLAIEATVDLLASGDAHAAVIDRGQVVGMLCADDLLGLEARSPIALRHAILGARDEAALAAAVSRLPGLFALLVAAGVPARDLGRVLTLQHDAVVARLIDFSIARHGPAPLPWAFLDLGSVARREFTLASDQDNGLAYATPEPAGQTDVDGYFARLGGDINDGLAACGIATDDNGVLAGRRPWRMSSAEWLTTFSRCLEDPGESQLIRATVAFDFRPTAGGLAVAAELIEVIRAARGHPPFMHLLARTATGYPVALGFRGQLATGRGGDPPDRLDLKRGGIVPLVNLVRFHALANGVTVSSTLDRIEAVASLGGLPRDQADALAEAFDVTMGIRLRHHGDQIAAGRRADNLVDPGALSPIARTELREALTVVRHAQRRVDAWVPAGR